jgi:hypothetical protein
VTRTASGFGDDVSQWLEAEGLVPADGGGPGPIADVGHVRALLLDAVQERRAVSYSEILGLLGHRFTRPKMRALCKTLDAIDEAGAAKGEPGLAVLVVRESDRLPGQGWWIGAAKAHGYSGAWEGPDAAALVARLQQAVFDYWAARAQ